MPNRPSHGIRIVFAVQLKRSDPPDDPYHVENTP